MTSNNKATDRIALAEYQRLRRYVLFGIILLFGSALMFIRSAWTNEHVHEFIESSGLILILAGILGRVWCTLYIGGRKSLDIVTEGPYSIMRNPLYFFSAVAAGGAGAQTGSIILALTFAIITVIAFHVVIRREEAFLSGTFGQEYRDYLDRVPRFFPKLSLFRDAASVTVRPDRVYRTFLDGLVFFVALPLLELVEIGQTGGVLPVLVHLY